jgi:PAS domain-containing protein
MNEKHRSNNFELPGVHTITEYQTIPDNTDFLSVKEMKMVFDSIIDGIIVTNLSGLIIDINERLLRKLNYQSKGDIAGKEAIDIVESCDRPRVVRELEF